MMTKSRLEELEYSSRRNHQEFIQEACEEIRVCHKEISELNNKISKILSLTGDLVNGMQRIL